MVADIQLLQGKVIDEPDCRTKNISSLIQELALEILSDAEVAVAASLTASVATTDTAEEPA